MSKTHTVNYMYHLLADPHTNNLTNFSNLLHNKGIGFISEYKKGIGLEYDVVIYIFFTPEDVEKAKCIYKE